MTVEKLWTVLPREFVAGVAQFLVHAYWHLNVVNFDQIRQKSIDATGYVPTLMDTSNGKAKVRITFAGTALAPTHDYTDLPREDAQMRKTRPLLEASTRMMPPLD